MFIGSNSTCLLKKMNFKVRERGKKEGEFQQLVAKKLLSWNKGKNENFCLGYCSKAEIISGLCTLSGNLLIAANLCTGCTLIILVQISIKAITISVDIFQEKYFL